MRRDALKIVVTVAVIVICLVFLIIVRSVLSPFVIAFVLAYLLAPAVARLERWRLPRGLAVAIVYIIVLAVIALINAWILPALFAELGRLGDNLPTYITQVQSLVANAQMRYQFVPASVRQVIEQAAGNVGQGMLTGITRAIQGGAGLISGLFDFMLAWILSVYFLLDWRKIGVRCLSVLPPGLRPEATAMAADMDRAIGGYIRGMLILALVVGIASGVVVAVAGMRFSLLFGLLSAVGEFVPYFGPLIGGGVPTIMALLHSPALALKILVAYVVIQQIESNLLAPRIVGHRLGLHPLVMLFALLAGQALFGLPGMMLAAPVAGLIGVLARHAGPLYAAARGGARSEVAAAAATAANATADDRADRPSADR